MADVVVINSNDDLLRTLALALEDEGMTAATVLAAELHRPGAIDALLARERPRVIIFDIAPRYDESWAWFHNVFCTHAGVRGLPIVVTTTDLGALRSLGVEAPVLEVVGKPYDVKRILEAIERALGYLSSPSPSGNPA